jgi:ribonuclease R
VLQLLDEHPTRSFKAKELQRALRIPHSRYRDLRAQLRELVQSGKIALLPRRRYAALGAATHLEGTVEGVASFATVVRLGDDTVIPLSPRNVEQVIPGDRVRIRRVREDGELRASIDRLLLAAPREVFGTLQRVGGNWVLQPEPEIPSLRGGLFLSVELAADCDGQVARGTLPAFAPTTERPTLDAVELLGAADHPRAAMLGQIIASGWPREFSDEAEEMARNHPRTEVPRRDLSDEFVFTMDPFDAKDHDDAVSIVSSPDGGWILGVHIADVAARVPEDSILDEEARLRTTSVYPPGLVLPMLPEALSAGACSLHHTGRRDTISLRMHYGPDGVRHRTELGLGEIRSRASLSYEQAEALLETDDPSAVELPRDRVAEDASVDSLHRSVHAMLQLATALRERRRQKGSLFFERPEREFRFAEDGHVGQLRVRLSLRSHWIVEEFMLEANRAVAEVLQRAELPLLWRVHESPDEQKIDALCELLEQFKIKWAPDIPVSGHDFADLFGLVAELDIAPLVHLQALRSLMKARYTAGWDGHFGLAFDRYTHFTSPIRRYPDLHNQRCLHRLVASVGREGWLDDAHASGETLARAALTRPAHRRDAQRLADLCSDLERRAQSLERRCADICAADALKEFEGEKVAGTIVSVVSSGLFVEIDQYGLDGFVGVETLGRDWFTYDQRRQAQVGERTGRIFRLGQRVRVLLEYVDVRQGRLWLGPIELLQRDGSPLRRNRE